MDKIYIQDESGNIQALGELTELDLTPLEDDDSVIMPINCEPIEIECGIQGYILRAILQQGKYNAYVLKRDGYLSPKNGRVNDEKT